MQSIPQRRRHTFAAKAAATVALIGSADLLLYSDRPPAATLGAFALIWVAGLTLVRPAVRHGAASRVALVASAGFGLVLVDDPSVLGWCLFWTAVASAALLPRRRFTDAIAWAGTLAGHAVLGIAAAPRDLRRYAAVRRITDRTGIVAVLAVLALPVVGAVVFLTLFASANPIIGNAVAAIRWPNFGTLPGHLAFWAAVLIVVWPSLRPYGPLWATGAGPASALRWPDIPHATLTLSLVTFNAVFAIQNGLDLAFLWSGAPLPRGVTLADYAHRGAYPLIATALLAGAFALLASRPGRAGADRPLVRRLLVLWLAQNVLLVASSVLRTLDYIGAYSLTRLRIAALAWMALVAVGLVLIGWRMVTERSARWLINANAIAAGAVLTAASVVDLGTVAASWNVRHARSAADLDLCYLHELGASSLLPMIELERRASGPRLRDQAAFVRSRIADRLAADQADWHGWTWRGSRRLAAARHLLGSRPYQSRPEPFGRECSGEPSPPPVVFAAPAPRPTPLTRGARP